MEPVLQRRGPLNQLLEPEAAPPTAAAGDAPTLTAPTSPQGHGNNSAERLPLVVPDQRVVGGTPAGTEATCPDEGRQGAAACCWGWRSGCLCSLPGWCHVVLEIATCRVQIAGKLPQWRGKLPGLIGARSRGLPPGCLSERTYKYTRKGGSIFLGLHSC
uniref:Uncharacterized protein n=1 Tax=Branchiostoma floridae TaxID=7739 RepID=C3ZKE2_BRAFL|eukprot:XP_002591030.1 hypothetical protein BRAFLDRAFT_69417 [Branchiostoma floridae]